MDRMPFDWFLEMPPVTRMWVVGIAAVSIAEQFHLVDEFQMLYSYSQAVMQHEYWRFVTCFLYFGKLNMNLMFNTYFLIRYSRMLEESFADKPLTFRFRDEDEEEEENEGNRRPGNNNARKNQIIHQRTSVTEFINNHNGTLEYLWMLFLIGMSHIAINTKFTLLGFLGPMLSNSLIYVWARRNPDVNLSFLGVFVFSAPYLPWVMLLFSVVTNTNFGNGNGGASIGGAQLTTELISIAVGHVFFFLEDIYPQLNNGKRLLGPPWYWLAQSLTTKPADKKNVVGKGDMQGDVKGDVKRDVRNLVGDDNDASKSEKVGQQEKQQEKQQLGKEQGKETEKTAQIALSNDAKPPLEKQNGGGSGNGNDTDNGSVENKSAEKRLAGEKLDEKMPTQSEKLKSPNQLEIDEIFAKLKQSQKPKESKETKESKAPAIEKTTVIEEIGKFGSHDHKSSSPADTTLSLESLKPPSAHQPSTQPSTSKSLQKEDSKQEGSVSSSIDVSLNSQMEPETARHRHNHGTATNEPEN